MNIPIPCEFGNYEKCYNKQLPLVGVSWFKWSRGMEYTYFFSTSDKWHQTDFYTTFESVQPYKFCISDELLIDDFIKHKGYPLKGRGFATGVYYENEKTYIDFIMTDMYLLHIKVQCDDKGNYVPNGDIIFPTGWDTEEKKKRSILKSMKFIQGEPLIVKEPQPKQMDIFDFINN